MTHGHSEKAGDLKWREQRRGTESERKERETQVAKTTSEIKRYRVKKQTFMVRNWQVCFERQKEVW